MQHVTADDGVTSAYDTWGTPSDRPSVLLHHGFVADAARNWVAGDHLSAVGDPRFAAGLVEFLGG
jgi:pimeloyl-ACP methyl ester carboxylesterase